MTDVSVLFPGTEVQVGDQTITVGTFKFKHFPPIMKFLDSLGNVAEEQILKLGSDNQLIQLHGFTAIVAESGEMIFDLLDMIVDQDREWIQNLELDDAFAVCMAAWEVNGNFLSQRILPMFETKVESPKSPKSQKTK